MLTTSDQDRALGSLLAWLNADTLIVQRVWGDDVRVDTNDDRTYRILTDGSVYDVADDRFIDVEAELDEGTRGTVALGSEHDEGDPDHG